MLTESQLRAATNFQLTPREMKLGVNSTAAEF